MFYVTQLLKRIAHQYPLEKWESINDAFWFTSKILAFFVGVVAIVLFLASRSIGILTEEKLTAEKTEQEFQKKKLATAGVLHPQDEKRKSADIVIRLGSTESIGLLVPRKDLSKGFSLIRLPGDHELYNPIMIQVIDGKLFVSMWLQDLFGKNVFRLNRNEWEIMPFVPIRSNYDQTGFEVIDEYDVVKMQIDLIDNSTIVLSGLFRTSSGFLQTSRNGFATFNAPKKIDRSELQKLRMTSMKMPDMFLYPKELHFGIRAPQPVYVPRKLEDNTRSFAYDTAWFNSFIKQLDPGIRNINIMIRWNTRETNEYALSAISILKRKGYNVNDKPNISDFRPPSDDRLGTVEIQGLPDHRTANFIVYPTKY